jgi:hypothetical protein
MSYYSLLFFYHPSNKLIEKILPRRITSGHNNLSWILPDFLNRLLFRVFAAELSVSRYVNIPIGRSIAAIVRRGN